jgi:hypothetical protein
MRFVSKLHGASPFPWKSWLLTNNNFDDLSGSSFLATLILKQHPRLRSLMVVIVGNDDHTIICPSGTTNCHYTPLSQWHSLPCSHTYCVRPADASVQLVMQMALADHLRPRLSRVTEKVLHVLHSCLAQIPLIDQPDYRILAYKHLPFSPRNAYQAIHNTDVVLPDSARI